MSSNKPLIAIDPKDLVTTAVGVVLGVVLLVLFFALAKGMGLATFVDHAAIPHQ